MLIYTNKITKARQVGYGDDEILSFLGQDPSLAAKIIQTRNAKYTDTEIVNYLAEPSVGIPPHQPFPGLPLTPDEKALKRWGSPTAYGIAGAAGETAKTAIELGAMGIGAAGGAIAGAPALAPGAVAGALLGGGIGYALGKRVSPSIDYLVSGKLPAPKTPMQAAIQTTKDVATGALYEGSGQVVGRAISAIGGKIISPLSKKIFAPIGKTLREIPSKIQAAIELQKKTGYPATIADVAPASRTLATLEGVLGYTPLSGDVMLGKQIAKADRLMQLKEELIEKNAPTEQIEIIGGRIKNEARDILERQTGLKGAKLQQLTETFLEKIGTKGRYEAGETLINIIQKNRQIAGKGVAEEYAQLTEMLPLKGADVVQLSPETIKTADEIINKELSAITPDVSTLKILLKLKSFVGQLKIKIPEALLKKEPELMAIMREWEGLSPQPLTWEGANLTQSRLGEMIDDILTARGGKGTTTSHYLSTIKKSIQNDMEAFTQRTSPDIWQQYLKAKGASAGMHELFPEDLLKLMKKSPEDILNKVINKGEITLLKQIKDAAGEEGMQPLREGFFKQLLENSTKNNLLDPKLLAKKIDALGKDTLAEFTSIKQREMVKQLITKGEKIISKYGKARSLEFLETLTGTSNEAIINSIVKPNNAYNIRLARRLLTPQRLKEVKSAVLAEKIFQVSGAGGYLPISSAKQFLKYRSTLKQLFSPEEFKGLQEFIHLGQSANKVEALARNASQTAPVGLGMFLLRDLLGGRSATAVKITGIPWLFSKVYTSSIAMKYMTSALKLPPNSPAAIAQFVKALEIIALEEKGTP